MWTKTGIESEGQYAFSCELLRTLRFIYEVQSSEHHPWRKTIDNILRSFLLDFRSINRPKEAEILFGLLRGCDFNGLAPFMSAITANKEKIQIIGFVNKGWLHRSPHDSADQQKVFEDFSQKDLKVLGVLYNDKHKEKCEFQLYDPNDIRLVNDTAPTHQNQQLFKNQFEISAEILNNLLEDSDLLSVVDEDDIGSKQLDIFQLNNRTMIMKMINYQLQNNSNQFLKQLKTSDFYQSLLKFVCKESSIEMKGDIMLLEWLEQRCFAIRRYACENQQSLVKQREVHITLVKDKLYISFQHPTLKGEKQLNGVQLKSAVNYKNFEEKKEVKLVHASDVFINQNDQKAEQQVVLIDPETLSRNNGLDIVNACIGAITYGVDLNKTIKNIFIKQRENRDKYLDLAQKTIFLVSEEDYRKILLTTQSSQFKRSATMKPHVQQNSDQMNEDNFDKIYAQELVNYGGFSEFIAKKTLDKENIEKKTESLVQLCKQIKEGLIEADDQSNQQQNQVVEGEQKEQNEQQQTESLKHAEERSEALSFLKQSFQEYINGSHSDSHEKNTKDALYDCINTFSKKDLALEYEKSLIRLFNMYCRHVFWSLIQKDDIEKIFSMVLETENEMKSFSVFLKVLGNECFITGNKVYIKGYKVFLKKVVKICCKVEKFRPLLNVLIEDGIINSYQQHMDELKTDQVGHASKRIQEYFKTETKAAQLMNPYIIVPLLKSIIKMDSTIIEPQVDRLVSSLISINLLFIGDYSLKDKIWCVIISILEKVKQRISNIPEDRVKSLLKLKVIDNIFSDFEENSSYEKEEGEYVRRILKDNSSSEIDGISRRDVEKLVYLKRAQCLQNYLRYHSKDTSKVLIEMLFKFYEINKVFQESQFKYKNNLMSHIELYTKILEQGKESKLNEYLLFHNKLEDAQKILTSPLESNHKEYEGNFTIQIKHPGVEKLLVKVNDKSSLRSGGAAILLSGDREGRNVEALFFENSIKKEQALKNIYSDNVYMHYPVYPSAVYTLHTTEENAQPQLVDYPLYKPLFRYEEQSPGKFVRSLVQQIQFVTSDNKIYLYKNEELRRYKDHLDIQQVTFGKQCRVLLLKNGKVLAEGRNKARHFLDNEQEVNHVKGVEIPFFEKKDRIKQIATFFQVTIAVTEKGKVFACGDKLAKIASIDNTKFGFFEVPLFGEEPEHEEDHKEEIKQEEVNEQPKSDEAIAQQLALEEPKKEEPVPEQVPPPSQEQVAEFSLQKVAEIEVQVIEQPSFQNVVIVYQIVPVQNQVEQVAAPAEVQQVEEIKEEVKQESQEAAVEIDEVQVQIQEDQKEEEKGQEVEEENKDDVQEEEKEEVSPDKDGENGAEGEMINTEAKDSKPELFAIKVWACKTITTSDFVYIALCENLKTKKMELRTIGQSANGQLGQGKDVKTSKVFKRVKTSVELRSLDDLATGYDHTLIVSKQGKVYGWGCYQTDDKHSFTPVHIPYFDKYSVIKLTSSQKTFALVSPKDDPSKRLLIVGKFAPLYHEDQVKVYDTLQGLNVCNIQPYGDKVFISTEGTYQFRKPIQNPYQHSQVCELCSKQAVNVLHFFKDKEEKFHYFCLQCVQSGSMTDKYQPDLMWVVKRPIKDLESKPWPVYDPETLLSEESRGTPQYITRYKINGKDQEFSLSLDEVAESLIQDINPMIYLRINKPLKPDSKIEAINLSDFYEQTNHYGLSINLTPDYGFNDKNQDLISKNQPVYDEVFSALREIDTLDQDLQKEFKETIEDFIAKKLKDQNLSDIKYNEVKIEELKFKSDKLNELSDNCKKYHIGRFVQYCQYVWGSFTYIIKKNVNAEDFSLLKVFNNNRAKIPLMLKNKLLKKVLENLGYDDSSVSIHVNRKKAREFFDSGKIDEKGEFTVFAQVWKGLVSRRYQGMRINSADKKAWFVKFIGEFALDQGGLFRESLTELCQELQSSVLNLLIPTQNQKNNHGENRDKWTLNPAANSPTQLQMFEFLGALIGMSVRSGILMSLNLPSFVWKQLTDEELTLRDLNGIDTMTVSILEQLKGIDQTMTEETFLQGYELQFTSILSNGEEVELIPGGKHIKVNYSNLQEFIQRTIQIRFKECRKQIKAIKKGINTTFEAGFLRMLSWQDLEYKVVGKEIVDIERLKEITVYRNCTETTETIKKFWKIMNGFTNEERMLYLKFVWGRTRLPLKEEEVTENHTIQMDENADQAKLPVGRTCFFRLEIPPYKNEDVFRDKLIYAIRFCTAIDADIENAVQHDDEHMAQDRREEAEEREESPDENEQLFGDDY